MVEYPAKILIVDDDSETVDVFGLLLKAEGYDVAKAFTASECLRVAAQERPDLILLDVMLPDGSGIEACRTIKSDPELGNTLIIQISGLEVSETQQVAGLNSGANLYLTKPIEYDRLVAQIQALLRVKQGANSLLLDQQQREFDDLDRLSSLPGTSVTARVFGAYTVRKGMPELFEKLVRLYCDLLDVALQQRAYRVEHNTSEYLHLIADQLGLVRAGPRDVVDIHRTAIKRKTSETNLPKAQAYVEEGRTRLVELMGYLLSYYRNRSLGAEPSFPSGAGAGDSVKGKTDG